MALATSFKRRARLRSACALSLVCAATVHAESEPPDRCIVADRAIGCVDERSVIELTTPRKNADSVRSRVRHKLASGQCRLFGYGEHVSLISVASGERTAVRRPSDRTIYWLPASWTQPADQCEPDMSPTTLLAKLGLPNLRKAAPESNDMLRLPDSPSPEDSGRSDYAYHDEHSNPAETTESHPPQDRAELPQSRDDVPGRDPTHAESEREDSRVHQTAESSEPHPTDGSAGRSAPPTQHSQLRSSTYARNRHLPRAPAPGSCLSGVIVTDDDIDPCEELRR